MRYFLVVRRTCIALIALGCAVQHSPVYAQSSSLPSWMRPNPGVDMTNSQERSLMDPIVLTTPDMERVRARLNPRYGEPDTTHG